jgi:hypothetical protein
MWKRLWRIWDKPDSSGYIHGTFKSVNELDKDDWEWLTNQPQYDWHMLKPNNQFT